MHFFGNARDKPLAIQRRKFLCHREALGFTLFSTLFTSLCGDRIDEYAVAVFLSLTLNGDLGNFSFSIWC